MSTDITVLLGKREIFWELQEIVKDNPKILNPNAFFDWMCTNYIAAVTIGVRRFTDQSRNVRSLWRMLYEILEHPRSITRVSHAALYRGVTVNLSQGTFDRVVGSGKQFLSQHQIRGDLRRLEDATERVRRLVNKKIAHTTAPGKIRRLPVFNDLDAALDMLDSLLCKYDLLLRANGRTSFFATRQYDWTEPLRKAWIPEKLESGL